MTTLETLLRDPATAGVWTLDPGRTKVGFTAKSFWGLAPVKGTFTEVSGDGQLTAQGAVFGNLDITAASLQTGISRRDTHLRSPDFFDVERYPEIKVVVTRLQPGQGKTADLQATLTIRGITKPLPLGATISSLDDGTVRISARTDIHRSQWDVAGNLIGMIPDAVTLSADTVFVKSQ